MADYDIKDLKFLVVDDDSNMRHLISTILSSLGVKNTATADNVDKAFGLLFDFEPFFRPR